MKTAGTSVEIALASICGEDDIITPISPKDEIVRKQLGYNTAQNYRIPLRKYSKKQMLLSVLNLKPAKYQGHQSAMEIKRTIDPKVWESYYKFSFDRNPWDKMVSGYFWLKGKNESMSLDDFVNSDLSTRIKGYELYSINGYPVIDKVFKYEELEKSFQIISKDIGLNEELKLPKYRAKGHSRIEKAHYKELLSKKSKELIRLRAAREIELLGYKY